MRKFSTKCVYDDSCQKYRFIFIMALPVKIKKRHIWVKRHIVYVTRLDITCNGTWCYFSNVSSHNKKLLTQLIFQFPMIRHSDAKHHYFSVSVYDCDCAVLCCVTAKWINNSRKIFISSFFFCANIYSQHKHIVIGRSNA